MLLLRQPAFVLRASDETSQIEHRRTVTAANASDERANVSVVSTNETSSTHSHRVEIECADIIEAAEVEK